MQEDTEIAGAPVTESMENTQAFVALLFGSKKEYLVCALLLGDSLSRLCASTAARMLLVSEDSPFLHSAEASALSCFWQLRPVRPIVIADASRTARHAAVFTKLHLFGVNARRVVFLDLDILVRSERVAELFEIPGPAGMLHGYPPEDRELVHGQEIGDCCFQRDDAFCACINAGVMRVDLPSTQEDRETLLDALESEARRIPASEATMLPEQYFLARQLFGWRHLHAAWNWEVGPTIEICQYGIRAHLFGEWAEVAANDIMIYHFSGRSCQPWDYLDLQLACVHEEVQQRFSWRDPKQRIARAVSEWCAAVDDLLMRSKSYVETARKPCAEHSRQSTPPGTWRCVSQVLEDAVCILRADAPSGRYHYSTYCARCWRTVYETMAVRNAGWLCPSCALYTHNLSYDMLGDVSLTTLLGDWLDYLHEDQPIATLSHCVNEGIIRVQFCGWQADLSFDTDRLVTLTWDGAEDDEHGWSSISGRLWSKIICWDNGAVWLHIVAT